MNFVPQSSVNKTAADRNKKLARKTFLPQFVKFFDVRFLQTRQDLLPDSPLHEGLAWQRRQAAQPWLEDRRAFPAAHSDLRFSFPLLRAVQPFLPTTMGTFSPKFVTRS